MKNQRWTIFLLLASYVLLNQQALAEFDLNRFLGAPGTNTSFQITWDGWSGVLTLHRPASFTSLSPSTSGSLPIDSTMSSLREGNGRVHKVTYWMGGPKDSFCIQTGTCLLKRGIVEECTRFLWWTNCGFKIDGGLGYWGTGDQLLHRIAFLVDFNDTPSISTDDQVFEGYVFTQTNGGFGGITWWSKIPFSFVARK